jgi:hypothetical protein
MSSERDFDDAMKDAEEELRIALENLLTALSQGPTITNVHSTGWTEDGTFTVYADMPDETLGLWCFTPGEPVRYSVHDVGMEPSAPLPNVVRQIAACAPGKRVSVVVDGTTYELPVPRNLHAMAEELEQLERDVAERKERALALRITIDDEVRRLIEPATPAAPSEKKGA